MLPAVLDNNALIGSFEAKTAHETEDIYAEWQPVTPLEDQEVEVQTSPCGCRFVLYASGKELWDQDECLFMQDFRRMLRNSND